MAEAKFVLVRHRPNGGRDEIATVDLPAEDVADINRALVRTMYRLWPRLQPPTKGGDGG